MSTRTIAEQICGVLVLELDISKCEVERFLEFYSSGDRRFDFKDGTMKGGWFLKGHAVGIDPSVRKSHLQVLAKVNTEIEEILRDARPKRESAEQVAQVA